MSCVMGGCDAVLLMIVIELCVCYLFKVIYLPYVSLS